jgi:hypothetical protein
MAYQRGLVQRAGRFAADAGRATWDTLFGYNLPDLNRARTREAVDKELLGQQIDMRTVGASGLPPWSADSVDVPAGVDPLDFAKRMAALRGGQFTPASPKPSTLTEKLETQGAIPAPAPAIPSPVAPPAEAPATPQRGFQVNIEDAYSKLGDVAAGGGRTISPERGIFVGGQKYRPGDKVYTQEEYDVLTGEGMRPTREGGLDPLVASQGPRGVTGTPFAERTIPGGGAYVVGSEADPMRRMEMQREAYQTANRGRFQDIAAELRTGGAKPIETAAQLSDKRELDKRKALIETMEDGPAKQDALAALQDEETAKRTAGLKDSDRFEGLKGSPDAKAREGRMAAYKEKLKSLEDGRVITKREAEQKAKEMKLFEQEDAKIANKTKELEILEKDLEMRREILGAETDSKAQATYQKKLKELEELTEDARYKGMGIEKKNVDSIRASIRILEAEDPKTAGYYQGLEGFERDEVWSIASGLMTSRGDNGRKAFKTALDLHKARRKR